MLSIFCNSCIKLGRNWKNSHKIPKFIPAISKYNCKVINYPSGKDDLKNFEKKKPTIALNLFFVKEMNIHPAYISKHNSNYEKLVLSMILNEEGSHYLAVKKLLALLREMISEKQWWFLLFDLSSFV